MTAVYFGPWATFGPLGWAIGFPGCWHPPLPSLKPDLHRDLKVTQMVSLMVVTMEKVRFLLENGCSEGSNDVLGICYTEGNMQAISCAKPKEVMGCPDGCSALTYFKWYIHRKWYHGWISASIASLLIQVGRLCCHPAPSIFGAKKKNSFPGAGMSIEIHKGYSWLMESVLVCLVLLCITRLLFMTGCYNSKAHGTARNIFKIHMPTNTTEAANFLIWVKRYTSPASIFSRGCPGGEKTSF